MPELNITIDGSVAAIDTVLSCIDELERTMDFSQFVPLDPYADTGDELTADMIAKWGTSDIGRNATLDYISEHKIKISFTTPEPPLRFFSELRKKFRRNITITDTDTDAVYGVCEPRGGTQ